MIHQRKGLPLGLKPGDDAFGVHARLDDLEGYLPADRLFLFRHENHSATTFADLLEQFVAANAISWFLANENSRFGFRRGSLRRFFQEIADLIMGLQQRFDLSAQFQVTAAGTLQISGALVGRQLDSFRKYRHLAIARAIHYTFCIML